MCGHAVHQVSVGIQNAPTPSNAWLPNVFSRLQVHHLSAQRRYLQISMSARTSSLEQSFNVNPPCSDANDDVDGGVRARPVTVSPWLTSGQTGRRRSGESQKPPGEEEEEPTELIINLYKRGEGWGEEILPHISVEQRCIKRKRKSADPWQVCKTCHLGVLVFLHSIFHWSR